MTPEIPDAAYLRLELPTYGFTETTPEAPDDFRGFLLAAPRRLRAGESLRLPVSALARFGAESAELPQDMWSALSVIVVEVQRNHCWVGTLRDPTRIPLEADEPGEDEPAPEGATAPDEDERNEGLVDSGGRGVASYSSHVDLRALLDIPPTPGNYDIHYTYGRWASNCVRIVVEPPHHED